MAERHQVVEMETFKAEMRGEMSQLSNSVTALNGSVVQLTDAVKTLTEHEIRRQEREDRQAETNRRFDERICALEGYQRNDEIQNAQGKQMRDFLMAKWPWLMVLLAGLTVVVPTLVTVVVKGL